MMKNEIIHIVLGKANPERMNGINKVVHQLSTKQVESGRKVSVWGITKDVTENYGIRNFETRLFKSSKNPFQFDNALKKAIVSKKGKAIFHLHGGWVPAFSSISAFLFHNRIPFVITPHGAYNTIAMKRSKWVKKLYFSLFEKPLLKRAMRIHCIGASEIEGTNLLFKSGKSFLLPYGYQPGNRVQKSYITDKDEFIVGFLGRLDIYTKGLDIILEGFEAFHKLENHSRLWIIGDSNERAELEKMISAKGLKKSTVLWGSRFGNEKDEIMAKMDVFAHPSRNEGLPATILEASSLGIPSIVTQATNMAAYIEDNHCGIAIENENAYALTEALIKMKKQWNSDRLRKSGEAAKQMVTNVFDWFDIVNKMDKLYETT